jgi:peptidoglycan/LPS O-acetylase OafA/YrhL
MTQQRGAGTQQRGAGYDLIRILAALSVFLYHAQYARGFDVFDPLANHGNLGVPVFFALSGYLVYRPFLYRPVMPVRYLMRRTMRMAPAWILAVVGVQILIPSQGPGLSIVMWSLFVEITFYALLPLLADASRQREFPLLAGLGLVSFLAYILMPGLSLPVVVDPILLVTFFWSFSIGMLLAVVERDRPNVILSRVWFAAGLVLVAAGLWNANGYSFGYSDPLSSLLIVLGAVGVMGALMGWKQQWAWAALGADATYSFYLWHVPVLGTLAPLLSAPATFLLGLLITGLISVVATVLLERPIRKWVRARTGPTTASPTTASPTSTSPAN